MSMPAFEARQDANGWYIWDLTHDVLVGYWGGKKEAEADAAEMSGQAPAPNLRIFETRYSPIGWYVHDRWTDDMVGDYHDDRESAEAEAKALTDEAAGGPEKTAPLV
ncbi:hypothetical protein ACQPXM_06550 [Kribbella sp. CA-253562]|uniref:hypothetical protein n=1 Tax=Kribbella sp. CA-253562 TaxID=3239942 RepID=UPI003D89E5CB